MVPGKIFFSSFSTKELKNGIKPMATDERNNSPGAIFFFLTGPSVNKRDNC
jgi:hypothetical protein